MKIKTKANVYSIIRTPLFWLALLYLGVGLTYAWVTPALEKHDEDGHYGYLLYLREQHTLPPLDEATTKGLEAEYKQPPLYYMLTAALTAWLPSVEDPELLIAPNPYRHLSVPGHRNDNRNKFLHPPYMTPLIFGARCVSLLFGLGTMLAAYHLARYLFPKTSQVPLATAAVVGFQPHFMFMATAINNDAAIAFWGTLIGMLLMKYLSQGPSPYQAILLGVCLGLASLTKVSGLVFVPLIGLTLLAYYGIRPPLFRDLLLVAALALLIGGWWYGRNMLLYNDPLSIQTHGASGSQTRDFAHRIAYDLFTLENTLWANPSQTFVSRVWVDKFLIRWGRISLGLVIFGLCVSFRPALVRKTAWLLASWPITFLILILFYWARRYPWAYGRLLLPAIAPLGMLLALGWFYAFPAGLRRLVLIISTTTLVIASALVPIVSIYPIYHPWREIDEDQVVHPIGTLYVNPQTNAPVAELIGYNQISPVAYPNTYLSIQLCWKPLAQTRTRYATFVHLLDLSELNQHQAPGLWGSRRTYPGLGNQPTDRWNIGDPFCSRVLAHVFPNAPTPLGAALEVGLLNPKTDQRLIPVDAEGTPISLPFIGVVPIISPEALQPPEQSAPYTLGDTIQLKHLETSGSLTDTLTLTLTWHTLHTMPYDATTFVHLRDAHNNLVAQSDHQPLNGRFPTSLWLPNQVVTDVVHLALNTTSHAHPLELNIGMYTWPDLQRLPVCNNVGEPQPDNMVRLTLPSSAHLKLRAD